jgi:hypothetical protein
MVKAACANSLWWLAGGPSYAAFTSALHAPDAAQERVLRTFLRKNSHTSFGREHGLPRVRTSEEFTRRVPIRNYDELRPWIDRIQRGEPQVLTNEPVTRLVPTSGSTAARKLIPYTASMHGELNSAISPWISDLYRSYPRALLGASYWSISPVSSAEFQPAEDSAVPIGFDDDAAYLGPFRKSLINAGMAVPPEVSQIASIEDWRYVSALLLLRRSDLSLVSVWHPSFFSLLLRVIQENWEQLLSEISRGACAVTGRLSPSVAASIKSRPNPRRAQELHGISPLRVDRLWPKLIVLSCWADGHAAAAAGELAQSLGSIVLQPKGLIATEGIISIPFAGCHPVAIRSHYLEFEEDSGRVLRASELRANHEYNVILTTGGGLWRYRLGDRIAVDALLGRTPSIRFVGKSVQVSDRMGEKLSDGFVASVFSKLFADERSRPAFAMLAPDVDGEGCRYTLYLSADAPDEICAKLDLLLSANPHYAYCRRLAQLSSPRFFRVSGDAFAEYSSRLMRAGKILGEIKPAGLSPLDDWSKHLSGQYESCGAR